MRERINQNKCMNPLYEGKVANIASLLHSKPLMMMLVGPSVCTMHLVRGWFTYETMSLTAGKQRFELINTWFERGCLGLVGKRLLTANKLNYRHANHARWGWSSPKFRSNFGHSNFGNSLPVVAIVLKRQFPPQFPFWNPKHKEPQHDIKNFAKLCLLAFYVPRDGLRWSNSYKGRLMTKRLCMP